MFKISARDVNTGTFRGEHIVSDPQSAVEALTGTGRVKGRAALSRALTEAFTGGEPDPADCREVARSLKITVTVTRLAPAVPGPRESYGVIMHRAPALPVY